MMRIKNQFAAAERSYPGILHQPFKGLKLFSLAFMNGVIDTGIDVMFIFPVEYAMVCVYKLFL